MRDLSTHQILLLAQLCFFSIPVTCDVIDPDFLLPGMYVLLYGRWWNVQWGHAMEDDGRLWKVGW